MKSKIALITLMLASSVLLSGCTSNPASPTDEKPSTWSLSDLRWQEVATGEIQEKIYRRAKYCEVWPCCSKDCLYHGSYFDIVFKHGKTFSVGQITRYSIVTKHQYGTLYKYNIGSNDSSSWFQWVLKERPKKYEQLQIKIASTTEQPEIIKKDVETFWQRADRIEDLKANDFVLIKLDDGIVAIGFVTYDKKWKLSLNKDKYQHGETLTNVSKWKRINL
jgi:hypothetical protein